MILNKRGTMSAVPKRMSAADDGRKACRRWSEVQRALPRSAFCGRLAAASHETSATRSADGMGRGYCHVRTPCLRCHVRDAAGHARLHALPYRAATWQNVLQFILQLSTSGVLGAILPLALPSPRTHCPSCVSSSL